MFFYLSFLRPLPRTADVTNQILISPQIANDLRTCYLEVETDIYYAWSLLSDCAGSSVTAKAGKLMTWKTSSMYKDIPISLPPNARPGQEWRLSLSCASPRPNFMIDLAAKDFGAFPLPVISMHVQLAARSSQSKHSAKQDQVERLYSIPSPSNSGSGRTSTTLCVRERTSFDLDKKIWDSGLGLSSWIVNLLSSVEPISNPLIQRIKDLLTSQESIPLKLIELGTGTGIVSICLSSVLESRRASHQTHIVATDLPSAMDLIEHNISTNKSAYPTVDLCSLVLDWDERTLPPEVLGKTDLIVMADVTYNTASFPSLVRTIDNLVRSSESLSGKAPWILLAYKQRDQTERTLWSMLRDVGIDLVSLDKVCGAGPEVVEIWLWSSSRTYG